MWDKNNAGDFIVHSGVAISLLVSVIHLTERGRDPYVCDAGTNKSMVFLALLVAGLYN